MKITGTMKRRRFMTTWWPKSLTTSITGEGVRKKMTFPHCYVSLKTLDCKLKNPNSELAPPLTAGEGCHPRRSGTWGNFTVGPGRRRQGGTGRGGRYPSGGDGLNELGYSHKTECPSSEKRNCLDLHVATWVTKKHVIAKKGTHLSNTLNSVVYF